MTRVSPLRTQYLHTALLSIPPRDPVISSHISYHHLHSGEGKQGSLYLTLGNFCFQGCFSYMIIAFIYSCLAFLFDNSQKTSSFLKQATSTIKYEGNKYSHHCKTEQLLCMHTHLYIKNHLWQTIKDCEYLIFWTLQLKLVMWIRTDYTRCDI